MFIFWTCSNIFCDFSGCRRPIFNCFYIIRFVCSLAFQCRIRNCSTAKTVWATLSLWSIRYLWATPSGMSCSMSIATLFWWATLYVWAKLYQWATPSRICQVIPVTFEPRRLEYAILCISVIHTISNEPCNICQPHYLNGAMPSKEIGKKFV